MYSRSMHPVGLGVCLAFLALSAAGQTATNNSSHAATAPKTTATANSTANAPTGAATAAPASGAKKRHSSTHHQMHHEFKPMGAASAAGSQESAYRAALRTWTGPAAQKDRCLNDAIARHNRSGRHESKRTRAITHGLPEWGRGTGRRRALDARGGGSRTPRAAVG